jgi:hypothetical protein
MLKWSSVVGKIKISAIVCPRLIQKSYSFGHKKFDQLPITNGWQAPSSIFGVDPHFRKTGGKLLNQWGAHPPQSEGPANKSDQNRIDCWRIDHGF